MRCHKIKVDPLPERIKKSHSVKTVSHLSILKIVVIKKKIRVCEIRQRP